MESIQTLQIVYVFSVGVMVFAVCACLWGILCGKIPKPLVPGIVLQMLGLILWSGSFCLKTVALSQPLAHPELAIVLGISGPLFCALGAALYGRKMKLLGK